MEAVHVGDYKLIASLGRGGMADVFLAARLGPERFTKLVVIKRLRADLTAQPDAARYRTLLLDEARLAARLHHPNIVQTYEVSSHDGEPYITMEYLDGRPIHQVMRAVRHAGITLPRPLVLRVIVEVLGALAYAHSLADFDGTPLRIVHRDVSPQNVFWTYDGSIKLVDFGVAKGTLNSTQTEVGLIKGKVPYMAPEQARGEDIDQRVDVFAVGILMWEMLSARRLFRAPNQAASLHKLLFERIPPLEEVVPGLDPAIAAICMHALARDRSARFASAAEMRRELEKLIPPGQGTREELAKFASQLFAEDRAAVSDVIKASLSNDAATVIDVAADSEEPTDSAMLEHEPPTSPTVSVRTPLSSRSALAVPPKRSWLIPALLVGIAAIGGTAIAIALHRDGEPSVASTVAPAPVLAAAVPAAPPAVTPILRLCGSNTIGAELAPALVEDFMRKKGATQVTRRASGEAEHAQIDATIAGKELVVDIRSRGTATAFEGLAAGDCDVGMASRSINEGELAKLHSAGDLRSPATEHVIALDGIAVIVHPNNRLRTLDRTALHDVFTGKITDWSALGGTPGPIAIYARDDKSGTYDTFKHLVLGGDPLAATARRLTASDQLADQVATDPAAIGFIGLAYIRSAKALAVADTGIAAMMATSFTVTTEDYLLSRRLYFYTLPSPRTALVAELVSYAMSAQGQHIVRDAGFVDLTVALRDSEPCTARCPPSYASATAAAKRVSLDFRFREGSDAIDSRATRDLDRLTQTMRSYPGARLLLFGFSDGSGDPATNLELSRQRAHTIAAELASRGITAATVEGLGAVLPVASNANPAGRDRNRRVEVWLRER
jgi:phosphate transport system substrate-binding protein